jgi:antitoxin HigA-1
MRITTHPGEVLREEFMLPLGIGANALARALDMSPDRIRAIIADQNPRAMTPDIALRLAQYFRTTAEMWLNLQQAYDLSVATAQNREQINTVVRPRSRG